MTSIGAYYTKFAIFAAVITDKRTTMIQRIQTLFLLIAAGLLVSMFFTPMVIFTGSDVTIPYIAMNSNFNFTLTTIFSLVCTILCIATIFMFRNRVRQMRMCNLNSLILIGYQVIIAIYFFQRASRFGEDARFTITAVFPICAAILTFIAMRYIARDEALVMASTRLRPSSRSGKGSGHGRK